ncbi:MAG: right-handed parallel beta-helix repeat-containing protein [Acidobacteria bacterium]|nr:right-handed parallel beta-helix repeat-containing protein [Acidobacteriota bacterium]
MGIQLLGVQKVTIRGTVVADCTGDGICIGNTGSATSNDIVLCDVVSTGNRRQALSLVGGDYISVYDSEFSYTSGTAPEDGIDIEPDSHGMSNIIIENCMIRGNEGCGLQVNVHSGGTVSSLSLTNNLVSYNRWNGVAFQTSNSSSISGGSIAGNAIYQNGKAGLSLYVGSGGISGFLIGAQAADGTGRTRSRITMCLAIRSNIQTLL